MEKGSAFGEVSTCLTEMIDKPLEWGEKHPDKQGTWNGGGKPRAD